MPPRCILRGRWWYLLSVLALSKQSPLWQWISFSTSPHHCSAFSTVPLAYALSPFYPYPAASKLLSSACFTTQATTAKAVSMCGHSHAKQGSAHEATMAEAPVVMSSFAVPQVQCFWPQERLTIQDKTGINRRDWREKWVIQQQQTQGLLHGSLCCCLKAAERRDKGTLRDTPHMRGHAQAKQGNEGSTDKSIKDKRFLCVRHKLQTDEANQ